MKQTRKRITFSSFAFLVVSISLVFAMGCSKGSPDFSHSTKALELHFKNKTYLDEVMTISDQRHLLERTGFGAPLVSIKKLKGKTRRQGVQIIVDGLQRNSWNPPPSWVREVSPPYWARGDMEEPEKQKFNMARDREMGEFRMWWVKEMIETPSPQTERLVLFWHNHFVSTYPALDEQSTSLARQNLMFRRQGSGNFRLMLKEVIRDAAMLNYLDNDNNKRNAPNENLARELLELFTLGEGNYDEHTVKEAARALTGYRTNELRDLSFEISPWDQDRGLKNILGSWGFHDGDDLIDLILEQPSASEFITRKFWRHYVSEFQYNETEIQAISSLFRTSNYDIKTLLKATLQTPHFWDPKARGAIIKSPVDLIIGTIRTTGILPTTWRGIPGQLSMLNQNLFGQPNVAGWPGGGAWITPANLLNRHYVLNSLSAGGVINTNTRTDERIDNSEEKRLVVRLASEDYQGPPRFSVEAIGLDDKRIWSSELRSVKGGHDTQLNGRIPNPGQLPWYSEVFEFKHAPEEVKSIRVHFHNDAAGSSGDRNLFVDWVRVGRRAFLSSDGRQSSGCPPNNKSESGNLYCAGFVDIKKHLHLELAEETPEKEDTLIVGAIHLRWGNDPDGNDRWKDITIGLENVRLNERFWNALSLQFAIHPNDGYQLQLKSSGCNPNCLYKWPVSAWRNDQDSNRRTVVYPLHHVNHLENHWRQLKESDRLLVALLWRAFPEIVDEIRKGRRYREKRHFRNWEPHFERVISKIKKTKYSKFGPAKPMIIHPHKTEEGMMMSMMMGDSSNKPPLPNGRPSLKDASEYFESLKKSIPGVHLEEVLLAINNNSQNDLAKGYEALITNPIYQLK